MGISIYKYVAPYTTIWWVLAIGYLYALADHMYMLCYPRSPPLPVFLTIYWIAISEGPTQAGAMFYKWKKMNDNDREFHTHGNSLVEIAQRARDKRTGEKEEKTIHEQVQSRFTEKDELKRSLSDKSEELNICESKFDDWNSAKAKDLSKLVSEETAVEYQQQELSRQRESVRKEIARLELEQKMLVKKIIDTDSRRKKLVKKRKRFEDQADEKIYEHKIEKAKLQDSIQKLQFELYRVGRTDFESSENRKITDIKTD